MRTNSSGITRKKKKPYLILFWLLRNFSTSPPAPDPNLQNELIFLPLVSPDARSLSMWPLRPSALGHASQRNLSVSLSLSLSLASVCWFSPDVAVMTALSDTPHRGAEFITADRWCHRSSCLLCRTGNVLDSSSPSMQGLVCILNTPAPVLLPHFFLRPPPTPASRRPQLHHHRLIDGWIAYCY